MYTELMPMKENDDSYIPRESDYAETSWDGTDAFLESTGGRWWTVFFASLVLTCIQLYLIAKPEGFSNRREFIPLGIALIVVGSLAMIGWVATIGLGACVVARWIFREPLRNLFRD